ncbi:E3 ubiquitin- ligase ATL6-like [Olea europaea subsp. europaea]|uniref:E3 ubiquitin- ligase ATL6-like n=1 Tax=Olea europaea subsp. europaea TaxID=158383 RepID=A0A8S0TQK0_OLEEU|nr:E3 ubiquitin- ligase ATL6-like [Olea europaea subsp. europaea]
MLGLGKFKSHSPGHSKAQLSNNIDRFTLRLPEEARKKVLNRAPFNRTKTEGSASKVERASLSDISNRTPV